MALEDNPVVHGDQPDLCKAGRKEGRGSGEPMLPPCPPYLRHLVPAGLAPPGDGFVHDVIHDQEEALQLQRARGVRTLGSIRGGCEGTSAVPIPRTTQGCMPETIPPPRGQPPLSRGAQSPAQTARGSAFLSGQAPLTPSAPSPQPVKEEGGQEGAITSRHIVVHILQQQRPQTCRQRWIGGLESAQS